MKTNMVMVRKMGNFDVHQRTKDSMFNATSLLSQWNLENRSSKEVTKFLNLKQTIEFIGVLEKEEDLHTQNCAYVKSKASRGKNSGTWMHPYLFIKFAMWINPKFEYQVIKFVYDQLIKNRHKAGDHYRSLTSVVSGLPSCDYAQLAKALNHIIFGKHEKDLRQFATPQQLEQLYELENKLVFSIDMGIVNNFDQLMALLTKIWKKKNKEFNVPKLAMAQ